MYTQQTSTRPRIPAHIILVHQSLSDAVHDCGRQITSFTSLRGSVAAVRCIKCHRYTAYVATTHATCKPQGLQLAVKQHQDPSSNTSSTTTTLKQINKAGTDRQADKAANKAVDNMPSFDWQWPNQQQRKSYTMGPIQLTAPACAHAEPRGSKPRGPVVAALCHSLHDHDTNCVTRCDTPTTQYLTLPVALALSALVCHPQQMRRQMALATTFSSTGQPTNPKPNKPSFHPSYTTGCLAKQPTGRKASSQWQHSINKPSGLHNTPEWTLPTETQLQTTDAVINLSLSCAPGLLPAAAVRHWPPHVALAL